MKSTVSMGLYLALLLPGPAPALSPSAPQAVSGEPRVNLAFVDSDVRDALRLVGRQCDVNMVISNKVQGTITLDLNQTTLHETLEAIANVGGFEYSQEGDIVSVYTLDELVQQGEQRERVKANREAVLALGPRPLVIELRYVDAERVEPIVTSLLSETGTVSILKTSDHVAQSHRRATQDSGSTTGQETQGGLQIASQVSTSTQGVPARSHTLVVFDHPANLENVKRVVERIDLKPQQVVIEARFVEVSLDENERLGIDWNAVARGSGAAAPHTFPFGNSSLGEYTPALPGASNGLFPDSPGSVTTPTSPGLYTFGTLDFTSFTALLELIQRDTDVEMVSNPRIVVEDRQTATILVGERYPILSANISEFGTVTEQLERYEPIGVQLEVTPSVVGDEVQLLVRPSTSSLGPEVKGSTGLVVARINSRQIDTAVTIRDGQTVVVGGLITTRESETVSSVPLLGDIPLLGRVFRHKSKKSERVDLVVFLTVTLLNELGLTEEQRRLFERTTPAGHALLGEGGASNSGEPSLPMDTPHVAQRSSLDLLPSPPRY